MTDPLSDTLALISARCAIPRGFTAGGRWGIRFEPSNQLKITAVVKGAHWMKMDGADEPVLLNTGDIAVFDGRHSMAYMSDPDVPPIDAASRFAASKEPLVRIGEGNETVSIGGHIDLNHVGDDLLRQALPAFVHVRAAADQATALRWLLGQLVHEMLDHQTGAAFASDQLAQLIFVHVLRASLAESASLPAGWLRALGDERIAPALRLMHGHPGRTWSLGELAKACAMSRTTFASRFKSVAGVPPLTYLHTWRMRLAQLALREKDIPMSELAVSLGFSSDSAFSSAFKRTTGIAPTYYRAAERLGEERI